MIPDPINILSKSGLLNNCNETSSACQAKTITREEAAAIVVIAGQLPLDAPNAYSDDDQSVYQKAINAVPYYGMNKCIGGPFQFQPSEPVFRDQFACMVIKSIKAGSTTELSGSTDKYSDEGASKWTNEINILAANDVIPSCSSIQVRCHNINSLSNRLQSWHIYFVVLQTSDLRAPCRYI